MKNMQLRFTETKPLITNHSDMQAYAASTLKRKYRETGLSKDCILTIHEYLTACANFYRIIDVDTAWHYLKQVTGEDVCFFQFCLVISADARNDELEYKIYPESFFYDDGDPNVILITAQNVMIAINDDFSEDDAAALMAYINQYGDETGYRGELPFCYDTEAFYQLYDQKCCKSDYYVPEDLMEYAFDGYYTQNEYTESLKVCLIDDFNYTPEEADGLVRIIICLFREEINGPMTAIQKAVDLVIEFDPKHSKRRRKMLGKLIQELMFMLTEANNHTYLPSNNGFAPSDMKVSGAVYDDSFQSTVDMARTGISDMLMNKLNRFQDAVFKDEMIFDNFENGVQEKHQKVGRNDPCPCGSGKKYKKCCGR